MSDLFTFDLQKQSLKKRWFGFKTPDSKQAASAILVYLNVEKSPVITAHIYDCNKTIIGDFDSVHSEINEYSKKVHKEMTGEDAPKPTGTAATLKTLAFFTQPWQGETRTRASGKLFLVDKKEFPCT